MIGMGRGWAAAMRGGAWLWRGEDGAGRGAERYWTETTVFASAQSFSSA